MMSVTFPITLRHLQHGDSPDLFKVALSAWQFTYANIFSADFVDGFVRKNYAPETIEALLPAIQRGDMFFDVALCDNSLVGFCNFGDRGPGMELFRLYLLPEYIGKGIGRELLGRGEAFVRSKGLTKYSVMSIDPTKLRRRSTQGMDFSTGQSATKTRSCAWRSFFEQKSLLPIFRVRPHPGQRAFPRQPACAFAGRAGLAEPLLSWHSRSRGRPLTIPDSLHAKQPMTPAPDMLEADTVGGRNLIEAAGLFP
jgi:GNAT superfamily N-acetyltransferase